MSIKKTAQQKIDKINEKIRSSRSQIDILELEIQKQMLKKRNHYPERLKDLEKSTRKERKRFINDFSSKKKTMTLLYGHFNPLQGRKEEVGNKNTQSNNENHPLLLLPLEMFARVTHFLGPIELISLSSSSFLISIKVAHIFDILYKNISSSMESFLKLDHLNMFRNLLVNANSFQTYISKVKPHKEERKKWLMKQTMIRLLFRILYFAYKGNRPIKGNMVSRGSDNYKIRPNNSFYFDKRGKRTTTGQPTYKFIPLTNGMFLSTAKDKKLCSLRFENFIEGGPTTVEGLNKILNYTQCEELGLTNLSSLKEEGNNKRIKLSRIVMFSKEDYAPKIIKQSHIYQLSTGSLSDVHKFEDMPFIDMNEVRFMAKLYYVDWKSQIEVSETKLRDCYKSLMLLT